MEQQPRPERVRLLPRAISDHVVDATIVGVLTTGFVVRAAVEGDGIEVVEVASLALAIVLVLVRRRYPVPALVLAMLGAGLVLAATEQPPVLLPAALVILFTLAVESPRRTALAAGAATTGALLVMVAVLLRRDGVDGAILAAIAWPAFATAAGTTVRSTRESVAAANERALRAEETREQEARRRVVEERLRIARDVHDLVAHHIAVVNVQAGVAEHLLRSDPAAADEALQTVRGAASTVIDQLAELLAVLRSTDDAAGTTPTPDLAAVDDLVDAFATSGLHVTVERSGRPRALTRSAELAGYRVVQEALTNAHKHGDGSALVALHFDDDGLTVTVSNPAADPPDAATGGFGLIGMTERVEATGGTVRADRTDDGRFEVTATLPLRDTP